jgi:putative flippase GtrA
VSIFDVLVTPGAAIGCVVGIGLSAALQWLFPDESMIPAQALIVVVCSVVGHVLQHHVTDRPPKQ